MRVLRQVIFGTKVQFQFQNETVLLKHTQDSMTIIQTYEAWAIKWLRQGAILGVG
jgi:hypothetical protein